MARALHKLNAMQVNKSSKPGYYSDGGGLFLRVGPTGAKSWAFRFAERGRTHEMGLGPCHTISLAEARQKAQDARKLRLDGINPIEARRAARDQSAAAAAKTASFRECADRYIAANRPGWQPRYGKQVELALQKHAYPKLGQLPIAAVELAHVMQVIEPIWAMMPARADQVRNRIEAVLDWATARGYRSGDNPARWRSHLDKLLPKKSKVKPTEGRKAMPYAELPAFIQAVRQRDATASRALEFCILTATRTMETLAAEWGEFDMVNRVWTIPPARMKSGKEHRVPLSERAVEILQQMAEPRVNEYVFPGKAGRTSEDTLRRELSRLGRADVEPHGFRSTFSTWAAERTSASYEARELSLAHAVGNRVERTYQRGELLDQRRRLMDAWAMFCAAPAAGATEKVVPIRA